MHIRWTAEDRWIVVGDGGEVQATRGADLDLHKDIAWSLVHQGLAEHVKPKPTTRSTAAKKAPPLAKGGVVPAGRAPVFGEGGHETVVPLSAIDPTNEESTDGNG